MASASEKVKPCKKSKRKIVQMNKQRDDSKISSETSVASAVDGVKNNHVATKTKPTTHESKIGDANFLKGMRIADPVYLFRQIQQLDSHSRPTGRCNFNDMKCYKEVRQGLLSYLFFKCGVCGYEKAIASDPLPRPGMMDINEAAVAATKKIGIGSQEAETFFSNLGVPYLSAPPSQTDVTDINEAAVAATNKIGIGFQEAETFFSRLGIPYLSVAEYNEQQRKLKQKNEREKTIKLKLYFLVQLCNLIRNKI